MRCLFEDLAFNDANADIRIQSVALPATARRDLWFLFSASTGNVRVRAFATRALAYAGAANTHIAAKTFAAAAGEQTVTLDPFSGAVPDLTGLTITGVFSAVPTDVYVWGYTASFDLVTAENIKTRLLDFAGDGMPLDGIAGKNLVVGDYDVIESPVGVAVFPGEHQFQEAGGIDTYNCTVPFQIWIVCHGAGSDAAMWSRCAEYRNAVMSILCDEHRESYGEVLGLQYQGHEGPVAIDENGARFGARLDVLAHYVRVFADRG